MIKKVFLRSLLLLGVVALMAGCTDLFEKVIVDDAALVGKWYALDNKTEFWRFNADGSGLTWDESDDVYEHDENVPRFNWTTRIDQIRIDIYGQMGQHVYYDWTVTRQTADSLTFEDYYDNSRTFVKTSL